MSKTKSRHLGHSVLGVIFAIVILAGLVIAGHAAVSNGTAKNSATKTVKSSNKTVKVPSTPPNPCSSNNLSQLILVSISARHLWACDYQTEEYSSAVITGMDFLAADLTPTGTYHIYAKERDVHLIGSDSTGSWNDYVYYWLPFLNNQYGTYGLHDATWRSPNAFGNISPNSNQASHGCVEMPLATAAWIYNWAVVGTTVTIET